MYILVAVIALLIFSDLIITLINIFTSKPAPRPEGRTCQDGYHIFGKWKKVSYGLGYRQHRFCKDCHIEEVRDL